MGKGGVEANAVAGIPAPLRPIARDNVGFHGGLNGTAEQRPLPRRCQFTRANSQVIWRRLMTRLKLLGAAAVVSTVLATPLMAQEATQEPGMIGFNYPNSHYLTGGYGTRTPWNTDRYPRIPLGGYVAYETVPPAGVALGVGPSPYRAYAYAPY
jgi:hypothetical protein